MSDTINLLTGLSIAAGVTSVTSVGVSILAGWRQQSNTLRDLEKTKEDAALASDDIKVFGRYIHEDLGSVRISDYADNLGVQSKVARALDRVGGFLRVEDPPEVPQNPPAVSAADHSSAETTTSPDTEMEKARQDILYGEVWNGLSRLRRHVEMVLSEHVEPSQDSRGRPVPLGQMITIIGRRDSVGADVAGLLRYAVQVSNAAVHGRDVSSDQAIEAWENASAALQLLQSHDTDRPSASGPGQEHTA